MESQVKAEFRAYFADVQKYVKMSVVLSEVGIYKSTFSMFMRGPECDHYLSVSKLKTLKRQILKNIGDLT